MKFYAVIQNGILPCFIDEQGENKCCSKKQLTASLSNAKAHCDDLRGTWPQHRYEVHEVTFTQVDHPFRPDWNRGM